MDAFYGNRNFSKRLKSKNGCILAAQSFHENMLPPDAGLDAPEKGKVTNPNTPIRCICGAKEIIGQTVNEATNRAEQRSRRTGSDVCPQSKPPVPSISEYSAENI